eukprot:GHVL01043621.1.p1 GENE.GHVL01043621.1~~GHVL01043621.1.p1  ORF type:complete len:373 (-),score=81.43 GHVL01043621.1:652-1770(-)
MLKKCYILLSKITEKSTFVVSKRIPKNIKKEDSKKLSDTQPLINIEKCPILLKKLIDIEKKNKKNKIIYIKLAKNIIDSKEEFMANHAAAVMCIYAKAGMRHEKLCQILTKIVLNNPDIRSCASSIMALYKLEFENLRITVQDKLFDALIGRLHELSFMDLRQVLILIARVRYDCNFMDELCYAMTTRLKIEMAKAAEIKQHRLVYLRDLRTKEDDKIVLPKHEDFLIITYCLGVLNQSESRLFSFCLDKIAIVFNNRLKSEYLDAFEVLEGLHLTNNSKAKTLLPKCIYYCTHVLTIASSFELLKLAEDLKAVEITRKEIWDIWCDEVEKRFDDFKGEDSETIFNIFKSLQRKTNLITYKTIQKRRNETNN